VTRRPWTRLLAALVAAWFAVISGEPRWLHACPTHDGAPGAGAEHAAADAHAAHGAHGAEHAAPEHAPAGQSHICTCLGECATAAPADVPVVAAVPLATVTAALRATAIAGAAFRPVAPDFFLPFANGPPAAARAA
jgi:hypothetical protein